ncbi:hypothetical protein ABTO13_19390, partial [Acinetobacter baumannii]
AGKKAETLAGGYPYPHVPSCSQGFQALREALQEGVAVLRLGQGLEGLGQVPVALGQGLGPAVGLS